MDKPRELCPDTRVLMGLAEFRKETELDQLRPVGTHYSLSVAIDASSVDANQKAKHDCLDGGVINGSVVSVYVPTTTNLPVLKSLDVSKLNQGLAYAGSSMRINEQDAREAFSCYKDNLARLMVEYGSRCKGDDTSDRCLSFGSDVFNPNVERVSLSGLDVIASTIQHGITSCKRPGGKGR